jgi:hypothetical protein
MKSATSEARHIHVTIERQKNEKEKMDGKKERRKEKKNEIVSLPLFIHP